MEITIRFNAQYIAYPACKQSELFAAIAGTKALTMRTLKLIKAMGYTVNVEQIAPEHDHEHDLFTALEIAEDIDGELATQWLEDLKNTRK